MVLTHVQLAKLLLEHYPDEKNEALEHLDFAIVEFREMKIQPSLERALRHKDILKASVWVLESRRATPKPECDSKLRIVEEAGL